MNHHRQERTGANDQKHKPPAPDPCAMQPGRDRDRAICSIIFLASLFVIVAISVPGIIMNDEWITTNQVHQLNIGHQIAVNEGKYGTFANGTPAAYFSHFNNILRYPAALALASMPAMKAIDLSGSNFRLFLVLFWAALPFLATIVIRKNFPGYRRVLSVRIDVLGAAVSLFLAAVNILLYVPFRYGAPDAPVEVAAVVFTSHLFFAATVALSWLIAREIFTERWTTAFATIACTACSTALLWAGTGKDHMASTAVFTLALWFFINYLRTRRFRDAAAGFFTIGILVWLRPDTGLAVFVCMALFCIAINLLHAKESRETLWSALKDSGAILFTAIGAIPFFINNLIITGNFLLPPLLLERKIRYGQTSVLVAPGSPVAVTGSHVITADPVVIGTDFFSTLKTYLFSISSDPCANLLGILFFPENGSIGFFIIAPIALLAFLLIPVLAVRKEIAAGIGPEKRELAALLFIATASIFVSILYNLHGVNTGTGISPDIRYLMPAYLPATLLGLLVLEKTALLNDPRHLVCTTFIMGSLLAVILAIVMVLLSTIGFLNISAIVRMLTIVIVVEVLAISLLFCILRPGIRGCNLYANTALPVLVLTVLALVLLMILIVPGAKYNGYSFWLPAMDTLHGTFLQIVVLPR